MCSTSHISNILCIQWILRNPTSRSYGQKFRDSGCIPRCLSSAGKHFFVKFLVLIDKVANKDSSTILWKIVAESRADNMCALDCYTEILHTDREVVKLYFTFLCSRIPCGDDELKAPAMLLVTCLLVLAICLNGNCHGHIS